MSICLPEAFKARLEPILPGKMQDFCFAMEQENYAAALRVNPFRQNALCAAEEYIDSPVPWAKNGYYIKNGTRPGLDILHAAGAYYIQEASAMAPAAVLNARPGEIVLDLCAAPGGKTSQIAASMGGKGLLIANEIEPGRAKMLFSNIERLGIANAQVYNLPPEKISLLFENVFDAVLVDAPCSGEGMFRREKDAILQWSVANAQGCAARQAGILDHAAKMVRPGGRMVYSTCTFNADENERAVAEFLNRHPDFSAEEFSLDGIGRSENGCLRVWPHMVKGDGQFMALLRRAGDEKSALRPAKSAPVKEMDALYEICRPVWFENMRFFRVGDVVFAAPLCSEDGKKGCISPGVRLFTCKKGRIEPEHSLAMALSPEDAALCVHLDREQAEKYQRGEQIDVSAKNGWALAAYKNMPLGWGKISGGVMKNHLPKGLRRH